MTRYYPDASYPGERRNDRDGAEDGAGLDAIRDEIEKLWAENASLRDDIKTLGAFFHITRTAVAAVALLIVVSMISGGSFVDVVGGGDEGAASARVGAAKEARRAKVVDGGECVDALAGGSHANVLLDNLAEQDESLVRLTAQHAALSGIVDVLIPREEGGPGRGRRGRGVRGPAAARRRLLAQTEWERAVMSPTSQRRALLAPLL